MTYFCNCPCVWWQGHVDCSLSGDRGEHQFFLLSLPYPHLLAQRRQTGLSPYLASSSVSPEAKQVSQHLPRILMHMDIVFPHGDLSWSLRAITTECSLYCNSTMKRQDLAFSLEVSPMLSFLNSTQATFLKSDASVHECFPLFGVPSPFLSFIMLGWLQERQNWAFLLALEVWRITEGWAKS